MDFFALGALGLAEFQQIVRILDPRVQTKNYGNAFPRALPKRPVEMV